MLPDRLSAYLRYFTRLAFQPPNRWDGFDLTAPDARLTSLRGQISFVGYALAALARHPLANDDERALAVDALAEIVDRLIQRRVWAAWASETERRGLKPDPVDAGYGLYSGTLGMLLGLQAVLGGRVRYVDDPFVLRWSADVRAAYTVATLARALRRQLQDSPEGALRCEGELATASGMAALIWTLRLHDLAYGGGEEPPAGEAWLKTLGERMAVRGPRLFNRGALAGGFSLESRRVAAASDSLEDAWGLALSAPLDRELVAGLAERHWQALPKLRERGEPLTLAFSYLLAVELGQAERAAELLAEAEQRLGPQEDDEAGRRYTGAPAAAWVTALYAIGEAGGMARLLESALPPLPPRELPEAPVDEPGGWAWPDPIAPVEKPGAWEWPEISLPEAAADEPGGEEETGPTTG